jgi:hypothetical protein
MQSTRPDPHDELHAPAEHTLPAEHDVPGDPASPTPHPAVAPQYWLLLVGSMQSPWHATSPGGHEIEHTPPAHVCPAAHCLPAEPLPPAPHAPVAPQNWLSVAGSMHLLPHSTCPGWHETWHWPPLQTCPWPQTVPHLPQLVLSVCVLVQNAPASVVHVVSWPQENAHVPPAQTCPVAHCLPQSPQLAGSVDVLMQEPLHVLLGGLQKSEHCPELQTCPAWQALPHLPQLSKSELRSAQVPAPHSVCVPVHPTAHVPLEHTRPPPQVAPHEPQFFGSFFVFTHDPLHCVCPPLHVVVLSGGGPESTVVLVSVDASGVVLAPVSGLLEQPTAVAAAQKTAVITRYTAAVSRLGSLTLFISKALPRAVTNRMVAAGRPSYNARS